jgi:hypothetical protein
MIRSLAGQNLRFGGPSDASVEHSAERGLPRKRRATLRGFLAILSSRSALAQQHHLDRVLAAARARCIEVVAARTRVGGALLAALALWIGALHSSCDVTGPPPPNLRAQGGA